MVHVLALGAGVQSTTMALLAAHGEIKPMPDAAVFADTGWEPRAVYDHLQWLRSPNVLPFPVIVTQKGNLRSDILNVGANGKAAGRFAPVPFFTDSGGMGRRQCTKEYKLYPVRDASKKLLNWPAGKRIPRGEIVTWIGISTDESLRMKPAAMQYIRNRWPLIELGLSRWNCLSWLSKHDYPEPPKSACLGCPYHSDSHWRDMRDNQPNEWRNTVMVDKAIRNGGTSSGINAAQYMHRSLKALDNVDLSTDLERGQPDLFNNECEGMCGV